MNREIKVNENTYLFVNEGFSNSRNWGHKTRLFKNNHEISSKKIIYLNRTWEAYEFQSCMKCAIDILIAEELSEKINKFKEDNDISRLKKELREALTTKYKRDSELCIVLGKL
jgi:hypothetical protein